MCAFSEATCAVAMQPPVLLQRGRVHGGRSVTLEVLLLLELLASISAQIELEVYDRRETGREVIGLARVHPLECSPPARALQCGLVGLESDGATLRRNELSLYRPLSAIPRTAYDANNQSNEWVRLGLPPPSVDDGCRSYSSIQQADLLRLRNEGHPGVVIVSGGGCSIATKRQLAQGAHAVGVVVAVPDHLQGSLYPPGYVRCVPDSDEVSIPQMIVSKEDYEDLRATLRAQGFLFSQGSMQHLPASVGSRARPPSTS